jgi:hypothetical protein
MSNSSSSRKQTQTTNNNYQMTDQSMKTISDSYNTYSDQGAINAAFDFSNDTVNKALDVNADTTTAALDFSNDTINRSLNTVDLAIQNALVEPLEYVDKATTSALDFAKTVSQQAIAPDSQTTKYTLIAAGLVAAAMVIKK